MSAASPIGWQELSTKGAEGTMFRAVPLAGGAILVTSEKGAALFRGEPLAGTATAPMSRPRRNHALVALTDGRAMAIGGRPEAKKPPIASCEFFDPASATWRPAPPLPGAREDHAAVAVGDRILVIGGVDDAGNKLDSVLAWTPGDAEWTPLPSLHRSMGSPQAVVLPDGSVIASDGAIERWNPSNEAWKVAKLGPARTLVTLVPLAKGGVVVIGGCEDADVKSVDILATDGTWRRAADLPKRRQEAAAIELSDGRIALAGGWGTESVMESGGDGGELDYEYRSFTPRWTHELRVSTTSLLGTPDGEWTEALAPQIRNPLAFLLPGDRVLVAGMGHCAIWTP